MQKQLNHIEAKKIQTNRKNNLIFVLENLEYFENIGQAFRLADCFNIEKIYIISKNLNFNKIKKTARNCEKYIPYEIFEETENAIEKLTKEKYTILNLEITNTSKPISKFDFSNYKKVAIIVGNEKNGISDTTLLNVPKSVHIEMYGKNSSMNVITALSICTYKITEDLKKQP